MNKKPNYKLWVRQKLEDDSYGPEQELYIYKDKGAVPLIAPDFLKRAQDAMEARAKQRDAGNGERSMAKTVEAFNAIYGKELTEEEGWAFMILLKMVRGSQGKFNDDDYVDGAAYFALLGECAGKKQ